MLYSPPKQRISQDSDSSNKYKNEWALLLDMHQKESELETIEMKRENQLRKLKYREELEKMIENQRAHHVRTQDEDAALLRMQQEHDKLNQEKEFQKNLNLKDKMYSCEVINRNEIAIRHRKQEEDKQNDLQLMQKVIRQASTEQQQESKAKQEQKLKAIHDLNLAYQSQEGVKALEKAAEKNKDKELMQKQLQQINAADQSRKQFMDRIKGGFKKNDKVENYYMQLHQQKQQEDQQFQHKYIDGVLEERQRLEEERQMAQARKRQEQSYKTHIDNVQQIEGKKIQQQHEQQFEQQYSQVVKSEVMQYEAQQKALTDKIKARQKDYFDDLKIQVEVDQAKKRQEGFMNPTEYNLNKNQLEIYSSSPQKTGSSSSTFIPIVPGIIQHRDYQRQKQLSMIDNKLGLNVQRSPNSESQRDLLSQTNSQHRRIKSFATQGQNDVPNTYSYNEVISQNNPESHSLNLFPNVPQQPSTQQPPMILSQSQQFAIPRATPKLMSVQSMPGSMPQNNNNNPTNMAYTMPINQQSQQLSQSPLKKPQMQQQFQQPQGASQYQQPSYQMNQQQYQQNQTYSPRLSQPSQPQQQQQQFPQIIPRNIPQNMQSNIPQGFAQNYLQSPVPLALKNPYQQQYSPIKQQQQYTDYKTGSVPPLPRYSSMGSLPDVNTNYNNGNSSPLKVVRNTPIQMINRNSPQKDQKSYLANQGSRVFE